MTTLKYRGYSIEEMSKAELVLIIQELYQEVERLRKIYIQELDIQVRDVSRPVRTS